MQSIQQIVTSVPHAASTASGVANALAKPRAAAAGATTGNAGSSGPSTAGDNTTITANDFLTLLVAEMKNQDPTQPTDPNAYISQMVGVNSLQQLIGINKGVTSLDTSVGATTDTTTKSTT